MVLAKKGWEQARPQWMVVVAMCEWLVYGSTVVTEDLPCTQIRRRTDSVTNRRIFFLKKTHEAN